MNLKCTRKVELDRYLGQVMDCLVDRPHRVFLDYEGTKIYGFLRMEFNIILINVAM